jgi:GDPmannose 4,6-dehydratase
MWRMLQADQPDDYVVATGEMHSVRDFLDVAGAHLGITWQDVVEHDQRYERPSEVDALCGDYSKARDRLGWTPTVKFDELVRIMIDADVKLLDDQLSGRGVRLS